MPHFNDEGHDTALCQLCGNVFDVQIEKSHWAPDLTGSPSAGLVCDTCYKEHRVNREVLGDQVKRLEEAVAAMPWLEQENLQLFEEMQMVLYAAKKHLDNKK